MFQQREAAAKTQSFVAKYSILGQWKGHQAFKTHFDNVHHTYDRADGKLLCGFLFKLRWNRSEDALATFREYGLDIDECCQMVIVDHSTARASTGGNNHNEYDNWWGNNLVHVQDESEANVSVISTSHDDWRLDWPCVFIVAKRDIAKGETLTAKFPVNYQVVPSS